MPDRTKAKHDRARSGVFISYARSDGKAFAARLRSQLEEKGYPLWQDIIAMEGGRDWWIQITEALDHVEFMALVITPNALKSDTVRKEWRYARQLGVCVYPIKGSPDLDFGSMPRWMREKHFYDLDEPLQREKFLKDLKTSCDSPRVPFMAEPLPPDFVPRPGEFNQLLSLLLDHESGDQVAITAALRGAGGYGKTTLAKALCHDEEVQNAFDGGILWVTLGERPGDLTRRVIDLIEVLTGERPGFSDVNAATARLRELLENRNALLVIDDVWDSVHLTPFTQRSGRGTRLITTRIIDVLPPNAKRVDVDAMRRDEAVALLGSGVPPECENKLRELAKRLGEWPLLLELANRALRHRVEDLLQSLARALEWVNKSLDKRGLTTFDARDPQAREQAVSKCLGVSMELLDPNERARFGELSVFAEDIEIPLVTLMKLWGRTGGLDDFDTEALCERLDRLSLLQRFDPNARVIRLHDVVRGYLIGEQGEHLAVVHDALLESHRPSSDRASYAAAALWADLDLNEPYLWDHIAHHLISAGRADELIATVKDLRYLAAKTLARKALAVEADLLAAENIAPDDHTLRALRRSFVQSSHLLDRSENRYDAEATLYSRVLYVEETTPLSETLAASLRRPYVAPSGALPDLPDPALVRTLRGHPQMLYDCAISGDGSIIVSASSDKTLKVWDRRSGAELRTLTGHTESVEACAISRDGSIIVSASLDKTLKVWDSHSGAELLTLSGHTQWVYDCAISSDGSIIVSASSDKTLRAWNARDGTELALIGHTEAVNGCAISGDGSVIVSASEDSTLKIWDLRCGTELFTLYGHVDWGGGCAISWDGSTIVSASGKWLKLWDGRTGALRRLLTGHNERARVCAISEDGSIIVSGSDDRTIRVWDGNSGAEMLTFPGHTNSVSGCAISGDGSIIVSASLDNTLKVWEGPKRAELHIHSRDVSEADEIALSGNRSRPISSSHRLTPEGWGGNSKAELRTFFGDSDHFLACAISGDGLIIVSISLPEYALNLWNGRSKAKLVTLNSGMTGCAISGDGLTIVSANPFLGITVWDTRTGAELHTIIPDDEALPISMVRGCAINWDGSTIVSASDDKTLKVWDRRNWSEVRKLTGHASGVNGCAISADGSIIVSASADKTLRLWDARTGAQLRTFAGHFESVMGCAISSDAAIIVSSSEDGALKVWDGGTGECMATLNVDGPLYGCAVSPDGERIVAAGARGIYFLRLFR
jgi:WD40 repeat protein